MYLAHLPINHHLRGLYRALAGLSGLYLVALGIYGLIETSGLELTAQDDLPEVLGQQMNPLGAGTFLVFGVAVLLVTVIGRNVDHYGNFWLGQIMAVISLLSLALLRTDANLLGFNMTSVIVLMSIGLLVLTSAMYAKVGPSRPQEHHEAVHAS